MSLTGGSVFSGIGGLDVAFEAVGLGPILFQVENDPYCRSVLARHWPGVELFGDVTQPRRYPYVDALFGGFPCVDVSGAGKGAGLSAPRSGLWWHFASIVDQIKPRIVLVENVSSGAKRWLPPVRRHLHLLGYDSTAYALSARDCGAVHMRRRIFVVAYANRVAVHKQPRRGERTRGKGALLADGTGHEGRAPWSPAGFLEPRVDRAGNGLPHRMERLKGLGNAVAPPMGEVIFRLIADACGRQVAA